MKLEQAISAGSLAASITRVQSLLAQVDLVIAENWPVTQVKASAPDTGASQPAGTIVDLLPGGIASPEAWKFAVSTARDQLQTQLNDLQAQLGAL